MELIARALVALRHVVVLAWIGGVVACVILLAPLGGSPGSALSGLVPEDLPAVQAVEASVEAFGFPLTSDTLVVERDPGGLSAGQQLGFLVRAAQITAGQSSTPGLLAASAVTNSRLLLPFGREHGTTALAYLMFDPDTSDTASSHRAADVRDRLAGRGVSAGVTGAAPARIASTNEMLDALDWVALATALLVALVVGIHFRSLVAPLINLSGVGIAYVVSGRVIATAGDALGLDVPAEVQPVIVVLLFGVVTDYTVFLLSRQRRALAEGLDRRAATVTTWSELAGVITAAAVAVAAVSGCLYAARLDFLKAFGPGMAVSVLIGWFVVLTWVPAILALLGPRAFWPGSTARDDAHSEPGPVRRWIGRTTVSHPVLVALPVVALLGAGVVGITHLRLSDPVITSLPDGSPPKVAYRQLSAGIAPGAVAPTLVLVRAPGVGNRSAALRRLAGGLARQPGFSGVLGPGLSEPLVIATRPAWVRDDAARWLLVSAHDPLAPVGLDDVSRLRAALPALARSAGLDPADVVVGGTSAISHEAMDATMHDARRVAPLVLAVLLLVLAVYLRAVVAPLYLLAASVLGVACALGVSGWLFGALIHTGGVSYLMPITAAILLLALGSDYNIFLAGRIWQEAGGRSLEDATAVASARASRPISLAGTVLALSFALLVIVPVASFRELAFAMTAGLLIDAFVVRTLLVPALISLVGPLSTWPGRRGR